MNKILHSIKLNNETMDFIIDNNDIEKSFDTIAKKLLTTYALYVNDKELRITEIEFYYYHDDYHKDMYTHEHMRKAGEWRFHNQGLDITFEGNEKMDGGILIRGVLVANEYINGPRNIIGEIFKHFNKVTDTNTLILRSAIERPMEIIKTFRHLPNKITDPEFHDKYYRYLVNLDSLKIPESIKADIREKSKVLE